MRLGVKEPVVAVVGGVDTVLTALMVGIEGAVDVTVVAVDTNAVLKVVTTGVLPVVGDSVVNVVAAAVLSLTYAHTHTL